MDALKSWILTIAGSVLILGIIDMILPLGKTRKTVTIASGFILMSVLVIPVIKFLGGIENINHFGVAGFLAEQEKQQIIDNNGMYTEEQLALIASSYKSKLKEHINAKVMSLPGIMSADSDVIIKEDYMEKDFGIVEKVYITAYRGDKKVEKKTGLGRVKKIEKIIIDDKGFRIEKSGQEPSQDAMNQELVNLIKKEISNELLIDENIIIVEIKN